MTPYYRREEIEWQAWRLLRRLEALQERPLSLPVDVDAVGEQLLGLTWLYEPIPEPAGSTIWAALYPDLRLVVLNERHSDTFGRNEGLERFTKAHELGHWVCHVLAVNGRQATELRPAGMVRRAPLFSSTADCRLSHAAARERAWQERQADWFAAALLMPPLLLRRAAAALPIHTWRGRYELRERCGVSITALNARLRQLGYPEVRE